MFGKESVKLSYGYVYLDMFLMEDLENLWKYCGMGVNRYVNGANNH